jgi:hemerythrin-like domain-containing protein
MNTAIDIIRAEHRALAAVLTGLQTFVDGIAEGRYAVDYELLAAMIQYVTEVPDRVHHPKENDFLFAALRKRSPEAEAILDDLADEHQLGPAKWEALQQALEHYRTAGPAGLPAFREAFSAYFDFEWHHMSKEESKVIPLARATLLPEDWAVIEAAFAGNDNPWEGHAGKYKQLFTRIVSLAPAPIGVGDGDRAP